MSYAADMTDQPEHDPAPVPAEGLGAPVAHSSQDYPLDHIGEPVPDPFLGSVPPAQPAPEPAPEPEG